MNDRDHIILYSHGFGVHKDDRGLFTDIAAALPNSRHVMFDYNLADEAANTLTVAPLTGQAEKLRQVAAELRADNPGATIDLICHSQGCIVAALAKLPGIRTTIFTAPPPDADIESKVKRWQVRYGTEFSTTATSYLQRKDGSTTVVPPAYWASLKNLDVQELYDSLAKETRLIVVTATQDEVLGEGGNYLGMVSKMSEVCLDKHATTIQVIPLSTGHNFEGEARSKLTALIAQELVVHGVRAVGL